MIDDLDYRIGLDIGTNSVGWAVIKMDFDEDKQTYQKAGIIRTGVRMFDKAEMPKTGASLAEPRRLARSTRKRLRRRSQRKKDIRTLLTKYQLISDEELNNLFPLSPGSMDIWDIRLDALDRLLNRIEWTRLLIHLAQRRGFQSNRKSELKESETGKVIANIKQNRDRLSAYRTVGEMWMKDPTFKERNRRRNSPNEYIFSVSRTDLMNEIITLFEAQRTLGSIYAGKSLEEEYLRIWSHQLPFASGNEILKKVGYCSLIEKERRIPKATYTFQYFNALDQINKTRIGSTFESLTPEQRETLLDKLFNRTDYFQKKNVPDVKYSDVRKWLKLDDSVQFKGLIYDPNEKLNKAESKSFINLKPYYEIRKVLASHAHSLDNFTQKDYDAIGYALTVYKTDNDIRRYLQNPQNLARRVFNEHLIEALLELSYTKFGHLSLKALHHLLPVMMEGKTFIEAAHYLNYDTTGIKSKKKSKFLPVISDEITNPIVKRAITQARKVVNGLIKKYGSPLSLHIELARELAKDYSERDRISKEQEENRKKNKGAIQILIENGIINPKGYDIVRYKLWKEQKERCAYSLKLIPAHVFFAELKKERGSAPTLEVDHILPYSQSFMDSYVNKVLVYSDENRKKGNRIPYNYFKETNKDWNAFEEYVKTNNNFTKKKREYLLKKEFLPREQDFVKSRHLTDTQYISRFFKNFVEQNLLFKESLDPGLKKRVQVVSGGITAHLRSRWGLEKIRQDTHLHHALDSVVVACTDQHMVTKITEYYQEKESLKTPKQPYFPWPWEGFRDELLIALSKIPIPKEIKSALQAKKPLPEYILVSRMPKRSVTGAAHKDTIIMKGAIDERGKTVTVKRVLLKEIKFDENGDFKMVGKETDPVTYEAIKQRYLECDRNVDKAFGSGAELLRKPSKNGLGNPIRRVKVIAETKSFVREVNGGVAENGDLVRIDLFLKENKYFMIPIYVIDTSLPELPTKIVTSGKGYYQWNELDDSYQFIFSLHPYDLVRVKKGDDDRFLYFSTLDIEGNRILFKDINKPSAQKDFRYTLSTIDLLEKYEVDILGDLRLVHSEKRRAFLNKN